MNRNKKPRMPRMKVPPPTKKFVDRKKEESKNACRGPMKDSNE